MDYDRTEIATCYDRARVLAPETARLWQDLLAPHIHRAATSLVIDLGCGTGRFSDLLATHFSVQVIGIDPSRKMIAQAHGKPSTGNVSYRQGPAEAIFLSDNCADLVFMSNVYHHLNDPPAVARECYRVLRPDGFVCIRNGTRETDFPQRHFFPGLKPLIDSQLPSQRDIERVFVAADFVPVVHKVVTQVVARDWPNLVEKSSFRADSFLARLSDEDFERGMAAMRSHGDVLDHGDPVTEEIDWFVCTRRE
jgi:ubiquinone/menaquinone biosynthesis C-methylase UbiE